MFHRFYDSIIRADGEFVNAQISHRSELIMPVREKENYSKKSANLELFVVREPAIFLGKLK